MKTTKRSKMLLSSIAMLLVALVALGSASFAWYYTNTFVTASSTSAKAAAADGLVIRKKTSDDWATSITYTSTDSSLTPSSWDYSKTTTATWNGVVGAKGTSNSNGAYSADGTAIEADHWNDVKSNVTYDDFYVATPSAGTKSVKLTISGNTVAGTYINTLVFVDGTLRGKVTSTPSLATQKGMTSAKVDSDTISFDTLGTKITTAFDIASNQTGDKNGSHVEVISYPEGQNTLCTTDTANTSVFSTSFRFDVA